MLSVIAGSVFGDGFFGYIVGDGAWAPRHRSPNPIRGKQTRPCLEGRKHYGISPYRPRSRLRPVRRMGHPVGRYYDDEQPNHGDARTSLSQSGFGS